MANTTRRKFVAQLTGKSVGWCLGLKALHAAGLPLAELRAAEASPEPLKVCLVSGSLEYKSDQSLAAFQQFVEKHYAVQCSRAFRKTDDDLPGLEHLESCDGMLLFTRRLTPAPEQLARIKRYCQSGRAIVGVRTASHAFQNWLALDKEVWGGDYRGHYGNALKTELQVTPAGQSHPVLEGFEPFVSDGSLYKNPGLAAGTSVLLTGSIPQHREPVAWTYPNRSGRAFYTSLGHPNDFAQPAFLRLLVNALFWTAQRSPVKRES